MKTEWSTSPSPEDQDHSSTCCDSSLISSPPVSCTNNHNERFVLCMDTPLSDVRKAAAVLGWSVHPVNSIKEAIQAMHNRSYEAIIVGVDTYMLPHGVVVHNVNGSYETMIGKTPTCSPLIGYAAQHSPSMFRIVYQHSPSMVRIAHFDSAYLNMKDSCIRGGADAVVSSYNNLERTLLSLTAVESIVVPVGTSTYFPLRQRQQREDQLIRIAQGRTTVRVKSLSHHTAKFQKQLQSIPPQYIHTVRNRDGNRNDCVVRMVHVSDTNTHHRYLTLPKGDLFVHTGNFTNPQLPKADAIHMFADFLDWLHSSVVPKFEKVVFIAGNHDDILDQVNTLFLREQLEARQMLQGFLQQHPSVTYLENTLTTFRGLNIYGSPTVYCRRPSKNYKHSIAFERRIKYLKKAVLEKQVDVFLTNRAPSILDNGGEYVLPVDHVYQMTGDRKQQQHAPKVHAFGHCNKNFGIGHYRGTLMMNGSQELHHSLDKYGGGTPFVIDIPVSRSSDPHHRMCAPRVLRSLLNVDGESVYSF